MYFFDRDYSDYISKIFIHMLHTYTPSLDTCIFNPDSISKFIKKVIYNNPATIVLWKDNTKTVVKCCEGDVYDKEKGLMACIIKKLTGNTGRWNEILKEWTNHEDS